MKRKLSRRDFLKVGVTGTAAAVLTGCQNPRRWEVLEPYIRPPEEQLPGVPTWYATTCRQCPAGCGIIVRIMNGRATKIEGNAEHPLNQGKLCARGQAGLQVLYNPDRLETPVVQSKRGSRNFQAITWDEGINTLYSKLRTAGSGLRVLLGSTTSTHLVDIFKRFTHAVGAPEPVVFDLYSAYHGYSNLKRTSQDLFQQERLPAYDLANADVIFSFGADFLGTWLSSTRYGIEFGRFREQPLGKRGYLVQFEPRMSITGAKADEWLPVRPGSEAMVAQAIARIIADRSYGSPERVERAQALAAEIDVNDAAVASDISVETLDNLARVFATTERSLAISGSTMTGQNKPINHISAALVLNMIAGVIDQPGGMYINSRIKSEFLLGSQVSSFDRIHELIADMKAEEVEVLLVHGSNPLYDLPESAGFHEAIQQVPSVVSFAPIVDETAVWADMVLPDRTYLESWGYEIVSPDFGQPIISAQQPVVEPLFDHHSTADLLLTVAKGIPAAAQALPWSDEVAYMKEFVSALPAGVFDSTDALVRWSRFQQHGGWWQTQDVNPSQTYELPPKQEAISTSDFHVDENEYPYYLYIYMSDLLSDGRGANQPWLQGSPDANTTISWQSWVDLNPGTAQQLGLEQGDIVRITSPFGEVEAAVYLYPAIRPDTVGLPLGQGHTDYGRYARNRGLNAINLVGVQKNESENSFAWAVQRVKITPTGSKAAVAVFESTVGVDEGFINKSFPGG